MAMLHPDDENFYISSPILSPQISALFATKLPSEQITSITSLNTVMGAYHKIYFINLNSGKHAILRVARPCIPYIKVENEVAALSYISRNCPNVPVPRVWFWSADATAKDNPIGFEYIVMDLIQARSLDKEWRNLDEDLVNELFDQIADHWLALRNISMGSTVGGLKFGRTLGGAIDESIIEAGPVVEETFWQTPDVKRYWNDIGLAEETFATLNIGGPFDDYRQYIQAHLRCYSHAVAIHPALGFARPFLPRVAQLVQNLNDENLVYTRATLAVKVYLGHGDTHLGNILFDGRRIVSVIDWEFAGFRPSFSTNPTPSVAWVDKQFPPKPSDREQRPVLEIWHPRLDAVVKRRAPEAFEELQVSADVRPVFDSWNWLRCICEVSPRGKRMELSRGSWSDNLDKSLKRLGL